MLIVILTFSAATVVWADVSVSDEPSLSAALSAVGIETVIITSDISVKNVITVNGTKTIKADGEHQISRAAGYTNGYIFKISSSSILNIAENSGLIFDGNIATPSTSFFYVNGTLNMNSGTLQNCNTTNTGAVNIADGGNFNMYGGAIRNCKASDNPAIKISGQNAICTIYGGEITGNVGTGKAAVDTEANATLTIYGGLFDNNTGVYGGAVYNLGKLNLYYDDVHEGAVFSNNKCGWAGGAAILSNSAGVVNALSGTFYGNNNTASSNVYEDCGIKVTAGTFNTGGKIHLCPQNSLMLQNGVKINLVEDFQIDDDVMPFSSFDDIGTQLVTESVKGLIKRNYSKINFIGDHWLLFQRGIDENGCIGYGRIFNCNRNEFNTTVQTAIDRANDGDILIAVAGDYYGDVNFTKHLTFYGAKADTNIDSDNRGENESKIIGNVTFASGVAPTINGFSFSNTFSPDNATVINSIYGDVSCDKITILYDGVNIQVKSPVNINSGKLLLGIYTDGRIKNVQSFDFSVLGGSSSVTKTLPVSLTKNDTIKVFLWRDYDSIRPLTEIFVHSVDSLK